MNSSYLVFLYFLKHTLQPDLKRKEIYLREKQWNTLYKVVRSHTLIGLFYDFLQQLKPEERPAKSLILQVYAQTLQIEQLNKKMNAITAELFQVFHHLEAQPLLLKGQGVATLYPNPLHRMSGDIDFFIRHNFSAVHHWAKNHGEAVPHSKDPYEDKHEEFIYKGICIENHFRLAKLYSKKLNRTLQKLIAEEIVQKPSYPIIIDGKEIGIPALEMGFVYLLIHFVAHFVSVGIGFRQVCDICLYLNKYGGKMQKEKLDSWIDALELRPFTDAFTALMVQDLGFENQTFPFNYTLDEVKKQKLFYHVYQVGNFGKNVYTGSSNPLRIRLQRLKILLQQSKTIYAFAPRELRAAYWQKANRFIHFIFKHS